MEIINLTMKDYKRMRKIIKNDHKSYQYTIDIEDREYPYDSKEFWMLKMVKALNIKDLQLRFEYIYKEMCDILDNISHKVCDFNCDTLINFAAKVIRGAKVICMTILAVFWF